MWACHIHDVSVFTSKQEIQIICQCDFVHWKSIETLLNLAGDQSNSLKFLAGNHFWKNVFQIPWEKHMNLFPAFFIKIELIFWVIEIAFIFFGSKYSFICNAKSFWSKICVSTCQRSIFLSFSMVNNGNKIDEPFEATRVDYKMIHNSMILHL